MIFVCDDMLSTITKLFSSGKCAVIKEEDNSGYDTPVTQRY